MYTWLLFFHSAVRWVFLVCLVYAVFRAYRGYISSLPFTKIDNALRHWTATLAHIQLTIGITLYFQSPLIKYFWQNKSVAIQNIDTVFFALIHITLMIVAVVLITVGSAMAKRKATDAEKFKTMLVWFSIVLLIILIAIPWPFSPLAARPYFRIF